MAEHWIKVADRKPPYGKLVYTRDEHGAIGVYTRYEYANAGEGWTSLISTDNNSIVEWLEQFHVDELRGICVYCGEIQSYDSLEQKSGPEGNKIRLDHILQCSQRPERRLLQRLDNIGTNAERIEEVAIEISRVMVLNSVCDVNRVKNLLIAFANEIKRQAIEP